MIRRPRWSDQAQGQSRAACLAGDFNHPIGAFAPAPLPNFSRDIVLATVQCQVRAKLPGKLQLVVVPVDDGDASAGERLQCLQDAEPARPLTHDRDALFAHDGRPIDRVDSACERIYQRGFDEIDVVRQRNDLRARDGEVLGVGAVAGESGPSLSFDDHALPDLQITCVGPDAGHGASSLMPRNNGKRHIRQVPAEDVEIGAADAASADSDEDFVPSDHGDLYVPKRH